MKWGRVGTRTKKISNFLALPPPEWSWELGKGKRTADCRKMPAAAPQAQSIVWPAICAAERHNPTTVWLLGFTWGRRRSDLKTCTNENGTDIFRPYSKLNPFREVEICLYPSSNIQYPIPYPYSNTQIAYLWCRYSIVSYPAWLILSVFESESGRKYENKYNISDIHPYLIRFHPYAHAWGSFPLNFFLEEHKDMFTA